MKAARSEILLQDERRHRLEHRDLEGRAFAGPELPEQGGADCSRGDLAHHMVGNQQRREARDTVALQREFGDAGNALQDAIIGGPATVRAAGTEPGDGAVHQTGLSRATGRGIEAKPRQRLRTNIRDQHVTAGEDGQQRLARLRQFQVKTDRAFAAVEMQVFARHLSGRRWTAQGAKQVAARRLDLDDLRSEIGEPQRRSRADDDAGKIKDLDAGQRPGVVRHAHRMLASSAIWPASFSAQSVQPDSDLAAQSLT